VLLSKTLRSSTLRLALIYVFVFSALIFGLLGYVYWSTLAYLHEKSDLAVIAQRTSLLDDLDRFREKIAVGLATGAGLFLLLAAAAGISTSRRSVARIEAINAISRKIMRAGLGERIPVRGTGDEWDGLADNLNSMLDRIEELIETNRRVSDNIAHDLRTPLTRMRGRLERACNQPLDIRQYRLLVNNTIAELDGILTTFSSLLRISRIEAQDRTAAFRTIDLSEITREVAELFDPSAEEKSIHLQLAESQPVCVVGDRDLLFDAISNLVDNAIKHGGKRGEVKIAVIVEADGPVLSIADRGPGIPMEERNNVFKRFYRLERSRNSPGNGLGLSLVAAVSNLHGARIEMTSNAPGLRVELHFPFPESEAREAYDQRGPFHIALSTSAS
jgi:signal transduction histidine kinase